MQRPESNAILLFAEERERQVVEEGYTFDHDEGYRDGELVKAAICYAEMARLLTRGIPFSQARFTARRMGWPWAEGFWKPSEDPLRNLVKAGALLAAEGDVLIGRTP